MEMTRTDLKATQDGIETGEKLLTADDLSKLFQVSTRQVWRWYHEQGLPGKNLSKKCVRFRWSDVAQWIEARAQARSA